VPNAFWRYRQSCHLFSDDNLPELHAFAHKLGLRREWFQDRDLPHYDLTARKRAAALLAGAVEADICKVGECLRNWRAWLHRSPRGEL